MIKIFEVVACGEANALKKFSSGLCNSSFSGLMEVRDDCTTESFKV